MTLAEARTEVAAHLDDANNKRWSTTEIDAALKTQVAACIDDYRSSGGERFFEEVSTTTTAGSPTIDLSSYDPLEVAQVSILEGNSYFPISQRNAADRGRHDSGARTVQIQLVRTPGFATSTSNKLVVQGDNATAMNSWQAFDSWVCAEAALQLAPKDNELLGPLMQHRDRMRHSCVNKQPVASFTRFPRRRARSSLGLAYVWEPGAQSMTLVQAGLHHRGFYL